MEYFGYYEEMEAYEGWQEIQEELCGQTSGHENPETQENNGRNG